MLLAEIKTNQSICWIAKPWNEKPEMSWAALSVDIVLHLISKFHHHHRHSSSITQNQRGNRKFKIKNVFYISKAIIWLSRKTPPWYYQPGPVLKTYSFYQLLHNKCVIYEYHEYDTITLDMNNTEYQLKILRH